MKKLKLDQIKVSSFITETSQVKGGRAINTGSTDFFGTRLAECNGNSHVFCSGDVACDIRHTFMNADTGGCKFSDLGPCKTKTIIVL